jgi:hypothetical protein
MKRTDKQFNNFIKMMLRKYDQGTEEFYTALMNYWIKYDLTQEQCEKLEQIKKGN